MKKQYLLLLSALLAAVGTAQASVPVLDFVADKSFGDGFTVGLEPIGSGFVTSVDWFPPIPGTQPTHPERIAYVGANGEKDVRVSNLQIAAAQIESKAKKEFAGDFDYVNGVSWLHTGKRFIATAGFTNGDGDEIVVYRYDDRSLEKIDDADMSEALAVDWIQINGQQFLAVGGYDNYEGKEVRVYQFENEKKLTVCLGAVDEFFHGYADSVRWLTFFDTELSQTFYYLAVGGFEQGVSIARTVRVYQFDPTACTLTLLATDPFDSGVARSVDWLVDGDTMYLAAGGYDGAVDEEVRVWLFDGATLSLIDFAAFSNGTVHSVAWLSFDGVDYLAVGGDDGVDSMEVRLYTFDGTTLTFATSLSLGEFIPNSLRWQIIDGDAYLAVGGSFADKPLKIFRLDFIPVE
jgi:WD40 repeat protein